MIKMYSHGKKFYTGLIINSKRDGMHNKILMITDSYHKLSVHSKHNK